LGLTLCPGKQGSSIYGHKHDRDLNQDLNAIKLWEATTVVTLMEQFELEDLKVSGLGAAVERLDMAWLHLPIVDVFVPDETFERRWVYFGRELRRRLARGEKILIHCRGGVGRTGLLAARILIEFGMSPEQAIAEVRRARRGAIETRQQEEYVRHCLPVEENGFVVDRVLGCLLGGTIGDGFGYEIEFDTLRQIHFRFGNAGLIEPVLSAGRLVVSDDTQMTLFTAGGLCTAVARAGSIDEGAIVSAINEAYLTWYQTQKRAFDPKQISGMGIARHRELWEPRAPGTTCMSALARGGNGTASTPINDSKGCGGVMRVAPLGLIKAIVPESAWRLGAAAAALTHGHPSGFLSAAALATIVRHLLDGADLDTCLEAARRELLASERHEETLKALDHASNLAKEPIPAAEAIARIGGGWVGEEALAIAIYAVLKAKTFVEAIRIAANHDGDSDSTASIAGQIWGATHGLKGIPPEWAAALDVIDPLCKMAQEILATNEVCSAAFEDPMVETDSEMRRSRHRAAPNDRRNYRTVVRGQGRPVPRQ
jgi:ADP-ribosylglycohydrolase/protein-tyrosine phosphatase